MRSPQRARPVLRHSAERQPRVLSARFSGGKSKPASALTNLVQQFNTVLNETTFGTKFAQMLYSTRPDANRSASTSTSLGAEPSTSALAAAAVGSAIAGLGESGFGPIFWCLVLRFFVPAARPTAPWLSAQLSWPTSSAAHTAAVTVGKSDVLSVHTTERFLLALLPSHDRAWPVRPCASAAVEPLPEAP